MLLRFIGSALFRELAVQSLIVLVLVRGKLAIPKKEFELGKHISFINLLSQKLKFFNPSQLRDPIKAFSGAPNPLITVINQGIQLMEIMTPDSITHSFLVLDNIKCFID